MRTELSSLDLLFLLSELRFLVGGRIEKIYQKNKNIRIEVHLAEKGTFEIYYEPGKIFISEYKRKSEEVPESFCLFLRKHLSGQRIVNVRQKNFDRIIEFETEKNALIFEVFSKGNVILCDKSYKVLMPLEIQLWKDRQILPKKQYQYPPSVLNPFKIDKYNLKKMFLASEKEIVRFLATDLSFSGLYAEEICARAEIDKTKPCRNLNENEISKIHDVIQNLFKQFGPQIVLENEKPVDVVPFDMKIYEGKKFQRFTTFTHALDEFFTEREIVAKEIKEEKKFDEQVQKLERIAEEQKKAIEKWKRIEKDSREKAEAIYDNYELVQNIILSIEKAKKKGLSWKEIKEKISSEDTPETRAIKEIREDEGIIVIQIQ